MLEAIKLVASVGPYPFILVAAAFAVWRAARWLSPIGTKILEAHVEGMSALKENTGRTADAVESLAALLARMGERLEHYGTASLNAHKTTQEALEEVMDRLDAIASEADIRLAPSRRGRKP